MDKEVTGQDATLKFGSQKTEIPVSNVSWSRDINTNDVQLNDGLNPTKTITGVRFSGSFEYDGRNWDAQQMLIRAKQSGGYQKNTPVKGTLTVKEESSDPDDDATYFYTFKGVVVTSQSRDLPSDGSASTSWDWEAEDVSVKRVV